MRLVPVDNSNVALGIPKGFRGMLFVGWLVLWGFGWLGLGGLVVRLGLGVWFLWGLVWGCFWRGLFVFLGSLFFLESLVVGGGLFVFCFSLVGWFWLVFNQVLTEMLEVSWSRGLSRSVAALHSSRNGKSVERLLGLDTCRLGLSKPCTCCVEADSTNEEKNQPVRHL